MKRVLLLALLATLLLTACQGALLTPGAEDDCPLYALPYPRPEPDYSAKLVRDFAPFQAALDAYTPAQAEARATLVQDKTIPELQTLMDDGALTATDLVVYYLDRIHRYDVDKLNAVLELNPAALEIAQALDDERAAGIVRGPMHGIPVLLKDNIATGDAMHTAAGAAVMLPWQPERDAFLVAQLRAAGAIILGKANLSEWANWMDSCMPNGFSTNGGQTQNPYGPYETYGSSSGSAVAVAADLTTVSVGTETQGSIIMPAAINSVVALKTSLGLVSRDHIIPLLPAQDVPGPMGRTVTDVAILLGAMTGVDANDPATTAAAALTGTDFTRFLLPDALAGVRVGVPVWTAALLDEYIDGLEIEDADVLAQLRAIMDANAATQQALVARLTAAGVTVVEFPITDLPEGIPIVDTLTAGYKAAINAFLADLGEAAPVASLAEIIAFNQADLANRAPYGQDHLEASQASDLSGAALESVLAENRATARARIDALFARYELDVVAADLGQLYAPAGYPALTVPAGYAADGTPQSLVLVGRYLAEPQLLAVGYAYEQATQARVAPDLDATTAQIEALSVTD
ncbi:MAG: amidase [Caldilineaceae bacterium]|nr:amidase [Caldilineaceae bacterium]